MGASTQDFFLDDENFEDAGPLAQNSNILADQSEHWGEPRCFIVVYSLVVRSSVLSAA